jgi:hypothetical protein
MNGGKLMQILTGTKREITLMQWDEKLEKAQKRLKDSKKCHELYGDNEDWIAEDEAKVKEIKKHIKEVTEYMDKNNIK